MIGHRSRTGPEPAGPTALSVLLLEDSPQEAELLGAMLRDPTSGAFEVEHVDTLSDALDRLASRTYDIAILDLSVPDSSGLGTVMAVTGADPELPIVVMTGSEDQGLELSALAAGAQDFIAKAESYRPTLQRTLHHAIQRQTQLLARRRAEIALKHSQDGFRTLIEAAPDSIFVHRDGLLVALNPAAVSYLGCEIADELIGKPFIDFVHADDRGSLCELIHRVTQGGQKQSSSELRFQHAAGEARCADVIALAIHFDGVASILMSARDITEKKQTEARLILADRMISSGILAAGVAHEVNNPLAYVASNTQYACEELESIAVLLQSARDEAGEDAPQPPLLKRAAQGLERARKALVDTVYGTKRIQSIVANLRAISDGEHDRVRPVDVREVVESAINLVWHQALVRCQLIRRYGQVPRVIGNAARLSQVFLNLLSNALQAIPEGDADRNQIDVSIAQGAAGRVIIEVRDTGVGMPPEVVRRVFDPFFTTKSPETGRGLGLSVCQKVVMDLGGEIRVESEVGRGSTFRVVLPVMGEAGGGREAE